VIGAGTAGLVTAAGAAGLGARVALADRCWCCGCGRAG
jgi:pyruvate/2-oxoglutarate dehydrogenase complex dihydrolipoamide dehydrogenase (E3) component